MFDHFIWEVVICPLLVAAAIRYLADRLRPDAAATFLVTALAAAAAACLVTVTAFAVKALAELPAIASPLRISDAYVRADTAQEPWVSWLSLAMTVAAVAGLARVRRRHRRDTAYARRYTGLPATGDRIVLLDDDRAEAFAVPGPDARIVVTTGMRAALDDTQYAALIAHERAHLRARHHRLILLAHLSAAVHPAFRLLLRPLDYLVERAADERAAAELDDRRAVARAIGAAALVADGAHRAGGLRITPGRRELRHAGAVPRRVASLLAPRGTRSLLPLAVPVLIAAFSVVWTVECVYDLGELLHAARR
ncbi:M48 family metalloprotease [Actinoplanes sp. NEAU-A12]|uniref:M48 family metalloprotease n=1 Tax=Actinoplanes sandaracinus TaxID=3045177 RepID=A0ABT6WIH3_9ACTN|nr:M48 family metalloprotease [Actinoplanes sandaracinus]MDI6099520.1 M48 family metalloprotease [Actinoplanes sandaracinus]